MDGIELYERYRRSSRASGIEVEETWDTLDNRNREIWNRLADEVTAKVIERNEEE